MTEFLRIVYITPIKGKNGCKREGRRGETAKENSNE